MSDWFEEYAMPALMGLALLGISLCWLGVGVAIFRWAIG